MKQLIIASTVAILVFGYCKSTTQNKPVVKAEFPEEKPIEMARQTHHEAIDTLLADSTAPLKPLVFKTLDDMATKAILDSVDLTSLLEKEWPDNGFYGTDHYRIEFVFNEVEKTVNDSRVYRIEGKNRYKKTISKYAGLMEVTKVSEFTDPNLDSLALANMDIAHAYCVEGTFRFDEDAALKSSGRFTGTFKLDFAILKTGEVQAWYYSYQAPTKGAGYVFTGEWSSYTQKMAAKPVFFARDFFMVANDILAEFSYGEREVEINPKYRHLGWDNFWDGEEWWTEGGKKAENQ
jgi:hypothetical protein